MRKKKRAMVLFSGGQDSTISLIWALSRYEGVETLGFSYGQRHGVEMEARQHIIALIREHYPQFGAKLGRDKQLSLPALEQIGGSSLTEDKEIGIGKQGLPNSFVPGRNLLFFTYGAAWAWRQDISVLVGGMCEADYSGYPDCREQTLEALQKTLALGLGSKIKLETPLMHITKAQSWHLAEQLGGKEMVAMIMEHSHSCYRGEQSPHSWGKGCGACPACILRQKGVEEYKNGISA